MCVYVCARESACVCAYVRACVCLRVRAHACTRDDAHVYACGAHVGAHADALAGSRTCGCTCVRARVCMYDYYIIITILVTYKN